MNKILYLKKHKNKIIFAVTVIILLVFYFFSGDDNFNQRMTEPSQTGETVVYENTKITENEEIIKQVCKDEPVKTNLPIKKDDYTNENVEEVNVEPEATVTEIEYLIDDIINDDNSKETNYDSTETLNIINGNEETDSVQDKDIQLSCTMSVRCDGVFKNLEKLDKAKAELIPENGVIYAEQTVIFEEGESVFDVLLRELKENKIHLEFMITPIYNSAYIEGIGNLYEFDCGDLSGWVYKVNGSYADVGCSDYILNDGDKIEWVYVCDFNERIAD